MPLLRGSQGPSHPRALVQRVSSAWNLPSMPHPTRHRGPHVQGTPLAPPTLVPAWLHTLLHGTCQHRICYHGRVCVLGGGRPSNHGPTVHCTVGSQHGRVGRLPPSLPRQCHRRLPWAPSRLSSEANGLGVHGHTRSLGGVTSPRSCRREGRLQAGHPLSPLRSRGLRESASLPEPEPEAGLQRCSSRFQSD